MSDAWIVDASPLILLAKADKLDLLVQLAPRIQIPATVADEVAVLPVGRCVLDSLRDWERPPDLPIPDEIARWSLDAGESQVLALALAQPGSRAVLDDLAARRAAEAIGVRITGTVGVILRAKQTGIVPAARPVLQHLRETGLYLSDRLFDEFLAIVGE